MGGSMERDILGCVGLCEVSVELDAARYFFCLGIDESHTQVLKMVKNVKNVKYARL